MHKCPLCPATFDFERDQGKATPPFPQDWWFYVVHDHGKESEEPGSEPQWRGILFHRSAGKRYPAEAKEILAMQQDNRKEAKQRAQTANASKGKRRKGSVA